MMTLAPMPPGSIAASPDSPTALAWAAGFADGEACIHIAKQIDRHRRHPVYRLGVHLTQNHLAVLERFRDAVGVAAPIYQVKRAHNHTRQCYTLNYTGHAALRVIELLRPHFGRKGEEADTARRFWDECRPKRGTVRREDRPALDALREWYFRRMRALK